MPAWVWFALGIWMELEHGWGRVGLLYPSILISGNRTYCSSNIRTFRGSGKLCEGWVGLGGSWGGVGQKGMSFAGCKLGAHIRGLQRAQCTPPPPHAPYLIPAACGSVQRTSTDNALHVRRWEEGCGTAVPEYTSDNPAPPRWGSVSALEEGTKSSVSTSPLPSRGPTSGRNCYLAAAF